MKDCVFCITVWYGVLGVEYSQFSRIFKWVLHKAKKKQNTTKGLKGQIINNYWMRLSNIMNYQNQGLCYMPKTKAEADNTDKRV